MFATLLGVLAFSAHAEPPPYVAPPSHRLWYSNATYVRTNPAGLVDVWRVGWRYRLSASDRILSRDTYTWVAVSALATPANARYGLYVEALPLAIVKVNAEVAGLEYFGTVDQVASFADPGARYSDETLAGRGGHPRRGWVVALGGTLQAKVGPVAVRSATQLQRFDLDLPPGDVVFYEQSIDRLVPDGGFVVTNDADAMVVTRTVRAGARYSFSDGLDGRGGETDGGLAHHRVGPLLAWQLVDKPGGARFDQPTIFALAQWWLQHPYRTGDEQPAALPQIAVGFSFNGDLWSR